MKSIETKSLDQDQAATLAARLGLHAANLRGILATGEGETISPPALVAGDHIGNIVLLTAHVNELEHRIGTGCPQFSAGFASGGTRPEVSSATSEVPGAKLTLTQQVIAAKGCKTLEELTARETGMIYAGTDQENEDEVRRQRKGGSGRPDDGDTNEHDRQKEEDAKMTDGQVAREQLGYTRTIAKKIDPNSGPTMTQKVLAAKGVKTLSQLRQQHARRMNSGSDAGD